MKRYLKLITVEPVLFLYMLAVFMQFGVMQDLIYLKVCRTQYNKNATVCGNLQSEDLDNVQRESSYWIRYGNIALSIPSVISSFYLGSWCSHFGAKIPMLLPALGAVFSNLMNVVMSVYMNISVSYIVVSQFISGISGSAVCVTMAVMSYISQVSSMESRTVRVGVLESMMFLGGSIGPFLGGGLLEFTSHAAVFLILLSINAVVILYVLLRISDDIPPMAPNQPANVNEAEGEEEVRRGQSTCRYLFGPQHFVGSLVVCFKRRDHGRRRSVLLLVLASVVVMLCTAGEMDTTYLFAKDKPLKWKYSTYSYYFGTKHGLGALTLMLFLPLVRRHLNPHDTIFGIIGLISKAAGLILLSLSSTTVMMFLVPLVAMMSTFPVPSMRSMLSKLVEPEEHGMMFAFVASMENLCTLVASVIFNSLYPETRHFFHGFTFVMCAALLIIPLIILSYLNRMLRPNSVQTTEGYSNLT